MVEHPWVRIAELKQDAANEEWQLRHPRRAWLRKQLHLLRVRYLLIRKAVSEERRVQLCVGWLQQHTLNIYLVLTRLASCQPRRDMVAHLSTRELICEMTSRRMAHLVEDCVERSDLLDALCGPAPQDEPLLSSHDEHDGNSGVLDKIV